MLVHVRMKIDLFVIVLNNLSLAQASQKYVITPKFILSWIQKYRRPTNEVPPKLIATYGNNFKFLGKEETTEQLLNGTLNKNGIIKRYYAHRNKLRIVIFTQFRLLQQDLGTGKTWVLEESLNMLKKCVEKMMMLI
ncbi:10773_t:CDS:2 [Entrophospora sp. SA101]|nr:10773_t:CDS:2 [Entrophospora sp. SA101]